MGVTMKFSSFHTNKINLNSDTNFDIHVNLFTGDTLNLDLGFKSGTWE